MGVFGDIPFKREGFVDGEPYLHVHLNVTSAKEKVCGHLVDGSPVCSLHPVSHFTIAIGRVEGAMVKMLGEPSAKLSPFLMGRDLVQLGPSNIFWGMYQK